MSFFEPDSIELYRELYEDDAVRMEAYLRAEFPETADDKLSEIAGREGLVRSASTPIDPSKPRIVLIHGITDCHLAVQEGGGSHRIWRSPWEAVKGNYWRYLRLQPDGVTSRLPVKPDGHMREKYQAAIDAWRAEGIEVEVFCYDWRKRVQFAADGLHAFLSQKKDRKTILVCHSMGGMVAATMAARFNDWAELVHRCVFCGSPLGGSFSVPMTIFGKGGKWPHERIGKWFLQISEMSATFPGLLDMLPNPELFPTAESLYDPNSWGGRGVSAVQLAASRCLKSLVWQSPIYEVSTHFLSSNRETPSGCEWNRFRSDFKPEYLTEGDGAVLNLASLPDSLTERYWVGGDHGLLVVQEDTIEGVLAIVNGDSLDLPRSAEDMQEGAAGLVDVEEGPQQLFGGKKERPERDFSGFDRAALADVEAFDRNALSMALASALVYEYDDARLKRWLIEEWGFSDHRRFSHGAVQGLVAWDDSSVVLAFRGSEMTFEDWVLNAKALSIDSGIYGDVHRGFLKGARSLLNEFSAYLIEAEAVRKAFWITGHSQGGALALLAGADLAASGLAANGIYTYGQPRVCVDEMASFMFTNLPNVLHRFVNHKDLVARVPPNFVHLDTEHWFDRDGEYGERPQGLVDLGNEGIEALKREFEEGHLLGADPGEFAESTGEELENLFGLRESANDHKIWEYIANLKKVVE